MRTASLVLLAFFAATLADTRTAAAYNDAPWCAVFSLGRGGSSERCAYWNFEDCRLEVVSGNRGFCRPNPFWVAAHGWPPPELPPRQGRHR